MGQTKTTQLSPDSYYYIKGDVIIELRQRLQELQGEVDKIAALIPEDPTYAFTSDQPSFPKS
jgi:hypothetical protein